MYLKTDSPCGSCAVAGISGLSLHKDPLDAMDDFCHSTLGTGEKNIYGVRDFSMGGLFSFYIFVAGPEDPGYGHSSSSGWYKYGTEFAEFITTNGLGTVVTPGQTINYSFHPDTTCQTWVWMPDRDAIKEWWAKRIDERQAGNAEKIAALEALWNEGKYVKTREKQPYCPNCSYQKEYHTIKEGMRSWKCRYAYSGKLAYWFESDIDEKMAWLGKVP